MDSIFDPIIDEELNDIILYDLHEQNPKGNDLKDTRQIINSYNLQVPNDRLNRTLEELRRERFIRRDPNDEFSISITDKGIDHVKQNILPKITSILDVERRRFESLIKSYFELDEFKIEELGNGFKVSYFPESLISQKFFTAFRRRNSYFTLESNPAILLYRRSDQSAIYKAFEKWLGLLSNEKQVPKKPSIRLGQASRKLNVGHNTILEFFAKKGITIESNPNALITPEQFEMLTNMNKTLQDLTTQKVVRLGLASKRLKIDRKVIINFLQKEGFRVENNPNAKLTDEQYAILEKEFKESGFNKDVANSFIEAAATTTTATTTSNESIPTKYTGKENTIPFRTLFNNDESRSLDDLLDSKRDYRAFATLLASKEIAPPLAVALFGTWGSGKSFFMNKLRSNVDQLSKHQGFNEEVDQSKIAPSEEKVFCEGIVQIEFNAWSYLDSNLWAGLVSTIYERLDEYINENVPGEDEKKVVQVELSKRLAIVSEQKKEIVNEKDKLLAKRKDIEKDIANSEQSKEDLLNKIKNQSLTDIRKKAKEQVQSEIDTIKDKLAEFDITEERIRMLSPVALYEEVSSWVTFFKCLLKFDLIQILSLSVAFVLLTILIVDPAGWIKENFGIIVRGFSIILSATIPVFLKLYSSVKKYKDLFAPILAVKNKFIESVQEAEFDYQNKVKMLVAEISETDSKLAELNSELANLSKEIQYAEHALQYSITKRAFFNFIAKRSSDEIYQKHLGIVSTIRRDFETLSNLFKGANTQINGEKSDHGDFRSNFTKPLDRIILYIDDLDRCSDEKVIEVLEAVHLLMAFPLFIVVVGVDPRCVNNALTYRNLSQYKNLPLTKSDNELDQKFGIKPIPPSEYLEKIFQVPFHLQSASEDSVKNLIKGLLKDMIDSKAPSGISLNENVINSGTEGLVAKTTASAEGLVVPNSQIKQPAEEKVKSLLPSSLKLSQNELVGLQELSWIVGTSPRTAKRYINTYRIIRAHELMSDNSLNQEVEFLIIMFLLALKMGRSNELALAVGGILTNKKGKLGALLAEAITDEALSLKLSTMRSSPLLQSLLDADIESIKRHEEFVNRFSFEF